MQTERSEPNYPAIYAKLGLLLILLYYTFGMVVRKWPWSFLDNINFPIHEFGHLLFTPFGEFIYFLGGSLFQVLFPLILASAFLLLR